MCWQIPVHKAVKLFNKSVGSVFVLCWSCTFRAEGGEGGRGMALEEWKGEGWEKVLVQLGEDGRAATGMRGAQGGEKETGMPKAMFQRKPALSVFTGAVSPNRCLLKDETSSDLLPHMPCSPKYPLSGKEKAMKFLRLEKNPLFYVSPPFPRTLPPLCSLPPTLTIFSPADFSNHSPQSSQQCSLFPTHPSSRSPEDFT